MLIASENLRGRSFPTIAGNKKWKAIAEDMRSQKIAVMALQETHLNDEHVRDINKFHKHILVINSKLPDNPTGAGGVSIVFNKLLTNVQTIQTHEIVPGRALLATWLWHKNDKMTILAVYAPTTKAENERMWTEIKRGIQQSRGKFPKPSVVLGDFNMVEDSIDRFPAKMRDIDAPSSFQELKRYLKIQDGWRETFPARTEWSWRNSARSLMSRIDRIYLTKPLLTTSRAWQISLSGLNENDHSRVTVEIADLDAPRIGTGRWTMRSEDVQDLTLLKEINVLAKKARKDMNQIKENGRSPELNPQTVWASFKQAIVKAARKRRKVRCGARQLAMEAEEKRRQEVLDRIQDAPDSPSREEARRELRTVETEIGDRREGERQRTFDNRSARVWADAETMKKSWFQWTNECKPRDTLAALARPNSDPVTYITDSKAMANMAGEYHDKIQLKDLEVDDEARRDAVEEALRHVTRPLNCRDKAEMDQKISRGNITESLASAKNGSAAGLDGIIYELWKELNRRWESAKQPNEWQDVVGMMTEVFEDVEEYGVSETTSFTDGWLCPLYKKGERTEIANYRPITLLNTDYKIYTKALALRLARLAPRMIHEAQAGFVRGRKITDLTKITSLILDYAEAYEEDGMIIALDQEKAYDRIRHDYLEKVLRAFGMPERFVRTVKNLYANARTRVMINGFASKPFRVTRGVRQGDPLSCLLFNLAIEPLAEMLRKSNLKGYDIEGLPERLIATLYADDTTVYLAADDSYTTLVGILNRWCLASGAKFNVAKTEIIPMGSETFRKDMCTSRKIGVDKITVPAGVRIAKDGESTRILGTWPGNGVRLANAWSSILDRTHEKLESWSNHYPTMNGRAILSRVFAGGYSQYLTAAQGMPRSVEKELDKLVLDFVWECPGQHPVNMTTLRRPKDEGGLDLFCAEERNEAQYITWLASYMSPSNERPPWTVLADHLFRAATIEEDRRRIPDGQRINPFYQSWRPNVRKLPFILQQMVKVARKYHLALDAPFIPETTRHQVGVWSHLAMIESGYRNSAPWQLRCLKLRHEVATVEDLEEIAEMDDEEHIEGSECGCENCNDDRSAGCRHPYKCQALAGELLGSISGKWNTATTRAVERTDLWESFGEHRKEAFDSDELVVFEKGSLDPSRIEDTPRIFVNSIGLRPGTAGEVTRRDAPPQRQPSIGRRAVQAIVCAGMTRDGTERARGGFTVVFPDGEYADHDQACDGDGQTYMRALALGIVRATQIVDSDDDLHLIVTNRALVRYLTLDLRKHERVGWMDVTDAAPDLRTAAATLRARTGESTFTHVGKKQRKEWPKLKEAQERATANAMVEEAVSVRIDPEDVYDPAGLSLRGLRQREALKAIRFSKTSTSPPRRATARNLARIKADLEEYCGSAPTDRQIWRGLRSKDMSRNVRNFLWKAVHEAHKIGEYFLKMDGDWKEKAYCPTCKVVETMEHILLDCPDSGQEVVWTLVGKHFEIRYIDAGVSIGTILGCANVRLNGQFWGRDKGRERSYRMVVSEAAFLIWKIRCIKRMEHEDDPQWQMPAEEITARWQAIIGLRERQDKLLANQTRRFSRASGQAWLAWASWKDMSKPLSHSFANNLDELGVLVGRDGRFRLTGVG